MCIPTNSGIPRARAHVRSGRAQVSSARVHLAESAERIRRSEEHLATSVFLVARRSIHRYHEQFVDLPTLSAR